jgi:hypothetical protein
MNREDIDPLLAFVQEMESDLQAIKTALYSTDEDYDDTILSAQLSLEKVAENLANTVKYLDEQLQIKELDEQLQKIKELETKKDDGLD